MFRLLRPILGVYVAGEGIGLAILFASRKGLRGSVVERAEIRDLAERARGSAPKDRGGATRSPHRRAD